MGRRHCSAQQSPDFEDVYRAPIHQNQLRPQWGQFRYNLCSELPAVIRLKNMWRSEIKKYEQQFMGQCVLKGSQCIMAAVGPAIVYRGGTSSSTGVGAPLCALWVDCWSFYLTAEYSWQSVSNVNIFTSVNIFKVGPSVICSIINCPICIAWDR